MSLTTPFFWNYCHEYYNDPPLHPLLFVSHRTMSSGESTAPAKAEFAIQALSAKVEVDENAQHEPQFN